MKYTCLLYIISQVLTLLLLRIYNIQSPNSFISNLLVYISFFKGFTQGDCVVLCTKKNLHYHYPMHLRNWTALKYILKKVWGYLSFVLEQPNPVSHKHKPKYLPPSRWAFQPPLFWSFSLLWFLSLLVVF